MYTVLFMRLTSLEGREVAGSLMVWSFPMAFLIMMQNMIKSMPIKMSDVKGESEV